MGCWFCFSFVGETVLWFAPASYIARMPAARTASWAAWRVRAGAWRERRAGPGGGPGGGTRSP